MEVTIGIGRTVMKHEIGAGGVCVFRLFRPRAQGIVYGEAIPPFQPFRLTHRQTRPHWEIRLRQAEGVFVIGRCFGGVRHGFGLLLFLSVYKLNLCDCKAGS